MQYEWETETKRIREELEDPLLKVVWDTDFKEYHILKLMPGGHDYIPLVIDGVRANLFYPTFYWHVVQRINAWDGRVYPRMRAARYSYKDTKTRRYEEREMVRRRRRSWEREVEDIGSEAGDMLYFQMRPRRSIVVPEGAGKLFVPRGGLG